ncbi:MAG TPA: Fic family protein [Candidatus Saccharimonadales bacterium]|nr:Fic family protein [Candidatus Saccharimonadales bacterium]
MKDYSPVYKITPVITSLVYKIAQDLERINIIREQVLTPRLRRENRIKTIRSSLYIEANTLSFEQVADVIDGKPVVGPAHDIQEVKSAIEAYNQLLECNPYSVKDLLYEHGLITKDTVKESGTFRSHGVGVFAGDAPIHVAPPAEQVPLLVEQLLEWVKDSDLPQIIKSCIFHYEFEFIHPFADGNGRMGRMWQTLLLYQENSVFGWLPVETIIAKRQEEYYTAIQRSTKENDSAIFAEFMLTALAKAVAEFKNNQGVVGKSLDAPLGKTEQAVLAAIMSNPYATYQEIADKISKTSKTVQRTFASLKDRGLISRVGSDKTGHWVSHEN